MDNQNKELVLREPTRLEDLDAKYGRPLLDALKAAMTIGGGVAGLESGPIGTIAGASLGSAGGQSLENMYKQALFGKNAIPSATHGLPEALVQGATAEMGGQILGKIIPKLASKAVPQKSLKDILDTDTNNVLRSEYHGSSKEILEPLSGKANTGTKGPEVFYTSPTKDTANNFATLRAYQEMDPELFNQGQLPRGTITPYLASRVNTLNLKSPVSFQKANELGELMGIENKDVIKAIMDSMNQHGNIDGEALWERFAFLRNSQGELGSPMEVGKGMIDRLKEAGYRRMRIPMDPGAAPTETVHFFPEEDLYSIGGEKINKLLDMIGQHNKGTQPVVSEKLADLLGKVTSNKAISSTKGEK